MTPYWCHHAVEIEGYENDDRNRGCNKNSCVDLKDGVAKPQKKNRRDMWISPGTNSATDDKAFGAFEQKQSNLRSIQRVSGLLEDAYISPGPLLNKRRKEGGREAAYEANKP